MNIAEAEVTYLGETYYLFCEIELTNDDWEVANGAYIINVHDDDCKEMLVTPELAYELILTNKHYLVEQINEYEAQCRREDYDDDKF